MPKYFYQDVVGLSTGKWSMDNPKVIKAVDGLLTLVKGRTDRNVSSWVPELSINTGLSQSQVRTLLRLGRQSRRANELWPGHALDHDMANGYRVFDTWDATNRRKAMGVVKTCETRLHNEVGYVAELGNATGAERLLGQMAENRASELNAMRQFLEESVTK